MIVNDEGNIEQWEEGTNRLISSLKLENGQMWVKSDVDARFSLHNWKCAGVVIPVFSLRTDKSYGVGDFGDLRRFVDWAEACHN